jgi:hypothetical protein
MSGELPMIRPSRSVRILGGNSPQLSAALDKNELLHQTLEEHAIDPDAKPADLIAVSLSVRHRPGFIVISVDNLGPTLKDARLNILAPYVEGRRTAILRIGRDGRPGPEGEPSVIEHGGPADGP